MSLTVDHHFINDSNANTISAVESEISFKIRDLRRQLSPLLSETIQDELLENILTGSTTELSLERLPVTDQDLEILLSYCPLLTSCDLSECTFLTSEGLKHLPSHIKNLYLRGLPNLKEEIFNDLAAYSSLEILDLSQTHVNFDQLHQLNHLSNLKVLFFWQCRQLTDKNIEWLKGKEIKLLDVSYCTSLTDQCIPTLMGAEVLSLDGLNYISDQGLTSLLKSNRLKQISLYNCPRITEKTARLFPPNIYRSELKN